jgi:hypothetical protein
MKGGWRFQLWQHFGGEKTLQINEEKNRNNILGLSRHGEESLSSRVKYSEQWLGWQEEEGGTVYIWRPVFSPGWFYDPRLKGTPFVSGRKTTRD